MLGCIYFLQSYACSPSAIITIIILPFPTRFMSGELQLNNAASAPAPPPPAAVTAPVMAQMPAAPVMAMAPAAVPAAALPTRVVELKQMLTHQDLEDDEEYNDILEDTRDECSSFGSLKNIVIPRTGPGATKIFLEYLSVQDAGKAIAGLKGRTFDGRQVEATYFDEIKFANEDYSD
jgi:hypothetical protein